MSLQPSSIHCMDAICMDASIHCMDASSHPASSTTALPPLHCAGIALMCAMEDSRCAPSSLPFDCRNRTDVCDGGFSKWAQITEGAVKEMEKEFGGLLPRIPMQEYSKCVSGCFAFLDAYFSVGGLACTNPPCSAI